MIQLNLAMLVNIDEINVPRKKNYVEKNFNLRTLQKHTQKLCNGRFFLVVYKHASKYTPHHQRLFKSFPGAVSKTFVTMSK